MTSHTQPQTNSADFPPYFMQPVINELKTATDPQRRKWLKMRLAINIGSPDALREILGMDSESLADFYGENDLPQLSTDDAIDTFLNRFASEQTAESLPDELPELPIVSDANAALELEALPEVDTDDRTTSVIDAFLQSKPPRTPHTQSRPTEPLQDEEDLDNTTMEEPASASLTESFARIMIKNGNFSKALDIITQLNLTNPEKSIYFADRIRFLRKLIANQEKKTE